MKRKKENTEEGIESFGGRKKGKRETLLKTWMSEHGMEFSGNTCQSKGEGKYFHSSCTFSIVIHKQN